MINEFESVKEEVKRGEVRQRLFNDESVFQLEKQNIFQDVWIPLGHESEIPAPGDYVVRRICEDELILVRDEDGEVHAFLNSCSHQGREVCRTERGNTSNFRCPYHGWTFSNSGELIGVPYRELNYADQDLSDCGLTRARCDSYNGLVFACLNPEGEPLIEYLGAFKFYLDLFLGRSGEGMQVYGPQRRVVNANWKLGVMNTMSDHHHSVTTHRCHRELNVTSGKRGETDDPRYFVNAGAGGIMATGDGLLATHPLRETFKETLTDEQWSVVVADGVPGERHINAAGSLLPCVNVNNSSGVIDGGEGVPFTYIRQYMPMSATRTEIFTWVAVEKEASERFKERARRAYELRFGTAGITEQDDVDNWISVTRAAGGTATGNRTLKYDMHLDDEPIDWPGPGVAYKSPFSEVNMRFFFDHYFDRIPGEEAI